MNSNFNEAPPAAPTDFPKLCQVLQFRGRGRVLRIGGCTGGGALRKTKKHREKHLKNLDKPRKRHRKTQKNIGKQNNEQPIQYYKFRRDK